MCIKIDENLLTLTVLYTFNDVFNSPVSDCRFLNSTLGSITKGRPDIGYSNIPNPDVILTCSTNGVIKLLRIDGGVIQNIDVKEKLELNEKFERMYTDVVEDRNIIVSKYRGYNSCDICIMCDDESMIVVSVHNHSMRDNSIICVFNLYGNLLKVLEEFPEQSHILSLCSKPIDYGLKREKSTSILRSIAIDETSSIIETINAIIKNVDNNDNNDNNDNRQILENTKSRLLDAQKRRSGTRSRPSTPIEMVFGDIHKRGELVDFIHPKPKRPKHKGGTRLRWIKHI